MSQIKITPYGNTIFVLPDKVVDTTKGGIILSDFSKKRPGSGTIIAIGDKIKEFKKGDRVFYGEFSGTRQIIDYGNKDTEIFIMTPEDVLAIIE